MQWKNSRFWNASYNIYSSTVSFDAYPRWVNPFCWVKRPWRRLIQTSGRYVTQTAPVSVGTLTLQGVPLPAAGPVPGTDLVLDAAAGQPHLVQRRLIQFT